MDGHNTTLRTLDAESIENAARDCNCYSFTNCKYIIIYANIGEAFCYELSAPTEDVAEQHNISGTVSFIE